MKTVPVIESVAGFRVRACAAGLKKSGKADLGLILADHPVPAAGTFTRNRVCAAPVRLTKSHLKQTGGHARAILVNAGVANACTGAAGTRDARRTARHLARGIGAKPEEILICSTGVIGHPLPMEPLLKGVDTLTSGSGTEEFARAIMTTDLVPKRAGCRVEGLGVVAGVCKGSGMIAPNMATMLGFLLTDIAVTPDVLQAALVEAVEQSFNAVTVDGDTSTNDTVLAMASGCAGNRRITKTTGTAYTAFRDGLAAVCIDLAKQIARDGEGATKLVEVIVTGAASTKQARMAARTVAESPLVKTALFGNDPNWGRILAALGRSGARMRESKVTVEVAGHRLFAGGTPLAFDPAVVSKAMKAADLRIAISMGDGAGAATFYTCDFSYDYVRINAEYHT